MSRIKNLLGEQAEYVLEAETRCFDERRAEFQRLYAGKVVVLRGTHFVGAFPNVSAAIQEARAQFGNMPCLIKEVDAPPLGESAVSLRPSI